MIENNDSNHFGFKQVTSKEKTKLVGEVFTSVSQKYDLMNDIMSFGIHRLWKNRMIAEIGNFGGKLLDLAGGTGDISKRFYQKAKAKGLEPKIILSDINPSMLSAGRDKLINENIISGIEYVVANAENLPFQDNSFDYVTIAFGIRNVTFRQRALSEIYRVLRPGGKFICLEFSQIVVPLLDKLYECYSFNLIPKLGQLIANDGKSYQYLVESIKRFPAQEEFLQEIEAAGFVRSNYHNLSGGIVAIHYGWRI